MIAIIAAELPFDNKLEEMPDGIEACGSGIAGSPMNN